MMDVSFTEEPALSERHFCKRQKRVAATSPSTLARGKSHPSCCCANAASATIRLLHPESDPHGFALFQKLLCVAKKHIVSSHLHPESQGIGHATSLVEGRATAAAPGPSSLTTVSPDTEPIQTAPNPKTSAEQLHSVTPQASLDLPDRHVSTSPCLLPSVRPVRKRLLKRTLPTTSELQPRLSPENVLDISNERSNRSGDHTMAGDTPQYTFDPQHTFSFEWGSPVSDATSPLEVSSSISPLAEPPSSEAPSSSIECSREGTVTEPELEDVPMSEIPVNVDSQLSIESSCGVPQSATVEQLSKERDPPEFVDVSVSQIPVNVDAQLLTESSCDVLQSATVEQLSGERDPPVDTLQTTKRPESGAVCSSSSTVTTSCQVNGLPSSTDPNEKDSASHLNSEITRPVDSAEPYASKPDAMPNEGNNVCRENSLLNAPQQPLVSPLLASPLFSDPQLCSSVSFQGVQKLRPVQMFKIPLQSLQRDLQYIFRSWEIAATPLRVPPLNKPPTHGPIATYLNILTPILMSNETQQEKLVGSTALYMTASVGIASETFHVAPAMKTALTLIQNLKDLLSTGRRKDSADGTLLRQLKKRFNPEHGAVVRVALKTLQRTVIQFLETLDAADREEPHVASVIALDDDDTPASEAQVDTITLRVLLKTLEALLQEVFGIMSDTTSGTPLQKPPEPAHSSVVSRPRQAQRVLASSQTNNTRLALMQQQHLPPQRPVSWVPNTTLPWNQYQVVLAAPSSSFPQRYPFVNQYHAFPNASSSSQSQALTKSLGLAAAAAAAPPPASGAARPLPSTLALERFRRESNIQPRRPYQTQGGSPWEFYDGLPSFLFHGDIPGQYPPFQHPQNLDSSILDPSLRHRYNGDCLRQ